MKQRIGLFWLLVSSFFASPAYADEIWLGATTTLRDSGFLEYILPKYEAETGDEVIVLAQSTGQIMQSAKDGNVDLLLTHHEAFENAFIVSGYGEARIPIMVSQFVLIGPADDPIEIRGLDMDLAFQKIAEEQPIFLSREDESGTSQKEIEIWKRNGIKNLEFPLATGQGMGATLNIASSLGGYTLSEIATFLQFKNKGHLEILVDQGAGLENIYAFTTLNPDEFAARNLEGAKRLVEFFTSEAGQALISEFKIANISPFTPMVEEGNESTTQRYK